LEIPAAAVASIHPATRERTTWRENLIGAGQNKITEVASAYRIGSHGPNAAIPTTIGAVTFRVRETCGRMAEINRRSDSKNYQANFSSAEKERTELRFNAALTSDQRISKAANGNPVVNVTLPTESIGAHHSSSDELWSAVGMRARSTVYRLGYLAKI